MFDADRKPFAAALTNLAAYYDRKLDPTTLAIYWDGLKDLTLEQIRVALNAHVQDPTAGQYMPKIADIRRAVEAAASKDDGHPGAEEAWAIAFQARDESASVVWTDMIASAYFEAAVPLLEAGDRVAARLAFVERYESDLRHARKNGDRARWVASLGTDAQRREKALDQAVRANRLTLDQASRLLPPSSAPVTSEAVALLESGVKATETSAEEAKARILALRAILKASA